MNKLILLLVIIFCYIYSPTLQGQSQPLFHPISGFSSSAISDIFQSSDGYYWFATVLGVSRFDGFTEQHYPSDCNVYKITQDNHQKIWAYGKSIYYWDNNKLLKHPQAAIIEKLMLSPICYISSLFVKNDTILLSLTNFGDNINQLYLLTAHDLTKIPIQHADWILKLDHEAILVFYQNHSFYFGRPEIYINEFLSKNKKTLEQPKHPTFPFQNSTPIYSKQISDSVIIVASTQQICFVNKFTRQYYCKKWSLNITDEVFSYFRILGVLKDKSNQWWIATDCGLFYYPNDNFDPKEKKQYLIHETITALHEDHEGNMWMGAKEKFGFICFGPEFQSTELQPSNSNFATLQVFENKLLAFNEEKCFVLDTLGQLCNTINCNFYVLDKGEPIKAVANKDDVFLTNSIFKKKLQKSIPHLKNIANDNKIYYDGISSKLGGTWFGGYISLIYIENDTITATFTNSGILKFRKIWTLEEGLDSILWLGTFEGSILGYNPIKKSAIAFPVTIINNKSITKIKDLGKNAFFVATYGNGLFYVQDTMVVNYKEDNGLISNYIKDAIKINDSTIWISSDVGIQKIILSEQKITPSIIHSTYYDLSIEKITGIQYFNKQIWVSTDNRIFSFRENYIEPKYEVPLNIIQINAGDTLFTRTAEQTHFELLDYQNNIILKLFPISIRDQNYLSFKYRLKGLNEEWTITKSKEIQFSNLYPGDYEFEVIVLNSKQLTNKENITRLTFTLLPRFTQTLLFKFLVLFAGVAIVFLIGLAIFFKQGLKQLALKEELTTLKYKILRTQMNPHFLFNAFNSVIGLMRNKEYVKSEEYLYNLSHLLRSILDETDSPFIPLADEMEIIKNYIALEGLRFNDGKLSTSILFQGSPFIHNIIIPPLLVQPLVENAIGHGMKARGWGQLTVIFEVQSDFVTITVEDNGIGRKQAAKRPKDTIVERKNSLGIMNITEEIKLINKLYNIDVSLTFSDLNPNLEDTGTRAILKIPKINLSA